MNLNDIVKMQDVNLDGKNVLVRVDYNVPLKDGKVDNPKRINATQKTIKYLKNNNLDDFTYNKAIQKMIESNRISKEEKDSLRKMKRL